MTAIDIADAAGSVAGLQTNPFVMLTFIVVVSTIHDRINEIKSM